MVIMRNEFSWGCKFVDVASVLVDPQSLRIDQHIHSIHETSNALKPIPRDISRCVVTCVISHTTQHFLGYHKSDLSVHNMSFGNWRRDSDLLVRHGTEHHWQFTCLFNSLVRLTTKITSNPASLALCEGNPSVTGGIPSQKTSNRNCLWR